MDGLPTRTRLYPPKAILTKTSCQQTNLQYPMRVMTQLIISKVKALVKTSLTARLIHQDLLGPVILAPSDIPIRNKPALLVICPPSVQVDQTRSFKVTSKQNCYCCRYTRNRQPRFN